MTPEERFRLKQIIHTAETQGVKIPTIPQPVPQPSAMPSTPMPMVNNGIDRTRYPTENLPKILPMPDYHPWEFRKNYPSSHGGETVPTPMVETNTN